MAKDWATLCRKLPCVSIAPLLRPVVPPVYCSAASVCQVVPAVKAFTSTPWRSRAWRPSASACCRRTCSTATGGSARFHQRMTPRITARGTAGKNWDTSHTTTRRIEVRARRPSSRSANMSTITSASAPLSTNWCSISEAV